MENKSINILSIGNSFGQDTMRHLDNIAKSAGIEDFKFANLYIGGCSIKRHHFNIANDIHLYEYQVNTGDGWSVTPGYSIRQAINETEWDIISIQHGTGDNSRYTSPESYEMLSPLVKEVKKIAKEKTKIAFNMAWVAEPDSTHHEITSYNGNQSLMYQNLTKLTKELISTNPEIDVVSPTGTAIQNARTATDKLLTRDGFHLSYSFGRYIAGLTFMGALCGIDPCSVTWYPDKILTEQEHKISQISAKNALLCPYSVTKIITEEI